MKIGIFNRYWNTIGGGERHVGSMIDSIFKDHRVELISVEPFDIDRLRKKLELRLCDAIQVLWPDVPDQSLSAWTSEYDIFVNATYRSTLVSYAKKSLYFTFFPQTVVPKAKLKNSFLRSVINITSVYAVEPTGLFWTYPKSEWRFNIFRRRLRITFQNVNSLHFNPEEVSIEAKGCSVESSSKKGIVLKNVIPFLSKLTLQVPGFFPGESDKRNLGLPINISNFIEENRLDKDVVKLVSDDEIDFVSSYDVVVANSAYTSYWIEKRWGRKATILTPEIGVSQKKTGPKKKQIVCVGRFFPEREGSHNKKQNILIEAFRLLCRDREFREEWNLVFVGSMLDADAEFIEKLKRLAEGLPIRFFVNVERVVLDTLYNESFMFWHATGYGESLDNPEKFEHFGITTCEAMSFGCIPVVYDAGGQREIVITGKNGYRFLSIEELCKQSSELSAMYGSSQAEVLSSKAVETSRHYRRFNQNSIAKIKRALELV